MGKVSIIAAVVFSLVGFILLSNMQQTSRDTDLKQNDYLSNQLARELAIKGRKMVLSSWMANGGETYTPVAEQEIDGGKIIIDGSSLSLDSDNLIIDFTVRGIYEGAVHDIRSRYRYNHFDTDVLQLKVADLDLTVDPNAVMDFRGSIALDDQVLSEMDTVLIQDLKLASSLSDFNLDINTIYTEVDNALKLLKNGNNVTPSILDADFRSQASAEGNNIYYPDQVMQAVENHVREFPEALLTVGYGESLPVDFKGNREGVLRVEDDFIIKEGQEFEGQGILVVEGDLIIEDNATFNWEGIIAIKPPASNLNPKVHFIGPTTVNGMLIAMQETIPNSGHMDVTAFRDYSGAWASPYGVDRYQSHWPWWLFHTHDYTSKVGNSVVFYAPTAAGRVNENRIHLYDTLSKLQPDDEIFLELYNPGSHGRSIVTIDLKDLPEAIFPAAAGFPPAIMDSTAAGARTIPFKISDLERLQIDVTRLSALKKVWDDSENPFPNCSTWGGTNGAICVGETHYRQHALTLRVYRYNAGMSSRIYETSLYWHRQEAEEEDFNDEMEDLVDHLTSDDFGLDMVVGDSTHLMLTDEVIDDMNGSMGEIRRGFRNLTNLATLHQHWEPDAPGNPLNKNYSADD